MGRVPCSLPPARDCSVHVLHSWVCEVALLRLEQRSLTDHRCLYPRALFFAETGLGAAHNNPWVEGLDMASVLYLGGYAGVLVFSLIQYAIHNLLRF